jgi:hypothetical protein
VPFDFTYPYASVEEYHTTPSPPPTMSFNLDPSLLELEMPADFSQYCTPSHVPRRGQGHTRSSSRGSVYSAVSTVDSTPDSVCTRLTTPPRASPPVRHHGPILLPKIRSQDQDLDSSALMVNPMPSRSSSVHHARSTPPPAASKAFRAVNSHQRSYTNPETLNNMAFAHMSFSTACAQPQPEHDDFANSLLCSPASFAHDAPAALPQQQHQQHYQQHQRRSTSVDAAAIEKYGYPTYRQLPCVPQQQPEFSFPSAYTPRAPSPLSVAASAHATPEPAPAPNTTLMSYLSAPNPAASLVRTISFPHRDPNVKHFWWDVRNVRSWSGFTAKALLALPGASALLSTPIPASIVPQPAMSARHPETEAALHAIYASYYLPKINAALAVSSSRPLQLSVPSRSSRVVAAASGSNVAGVNDLVFTANVAGESATAAAMFGGKPTARVVGIVRTFDRFNTGMRAEGNIKRVEYLRGLAAIHHAMREHGCRYGFILTEIELVLVRNGTESTPFFGDLEVTSVQLAATGDGFVPNKDGDDAATSSPPLTACLALWGLCQLAGDRVQPGHPAWKAEIGAPAEGTRRKAQPRDKWMPAPQLAEKREAKRSRGWVWPEDAVGRKELGKRGVRYGGI